MKEIIKLFFSICDNIARNISNYLLGIGLLLVLLFIYISFGTTYTILSTGILLIITSVLVELNKK